MKKSCKMMKTVNRIMSKYGFKENELTFGVEAIESNRHGNGYYDWAELYCPVTHLHFVVGFDGNVSK